MLKYSQAGGMGVQGLNTCQAGLLVHSLRSMPDLLPLPCYGGEIAILHRVWKSVSPLDNLGKRLPPLKLRLTLCQSL